MTVKSRVHFEQLSGSELNVINQIFEAAREAATARAVPLANDDRAANAEEALAEWIVKSRR